MNFDNNCGIRLVNKFGIWVCPKHKTNIHRPPQRKRGVKYSGLSKRPFGKYEDY